MTADIAEVLPVPDQPELPLVMPLTKEVAALLRLSDSQDQVSPCSYARMFIPCWPKVFISPRLSEAPGSADTGSLSSVGPFRSLDEGGFASAGMFGVLSPP